LSSANVASLMIGTIDPLRIASTILASAPLEESNPETMTLVSTTTRTPPSHRIHFCGDLLLP